MAPTVEGRPRLSGDLVARTLRELYGLEGSLGPLPGEWDQNLRLDAGGSGTYVVKVSNRGHEDRILEFQNAALAYLTGTGMKAQVPRVIPSKRGEPIARFQDREGLTHRMRVLSWIEGESLSSHLPLSGGHLKGIGAGLGKLGRSLEAFTHPAMDRDLFWDLRRAGWISSWTRLIEDRDRRALVELNLLDFRGRIEPELDRLPRQVIHNDANDANILVAPGKAGDLRVAGFLDFGDMVRTQRIHDLAIAGAYALDAAGDVARDLECLVAGYVESRPLQEEEILLLLNPPRS